MKNVLLTYWCNVNNNSINGYSLIGYNSEKEYFTGTMEECLQFAKANNMKVHQA